MSRHEDFMRSMYRGGSADRRARAFARLWATVYARVPIGVRWVTLEVPGRKSGKLTRFPLGMADVGGQWFLVSMLGDSNWVRNVRANQGQARLLRAGWSLRVTLLEVPIDERPALIKRYLQKVPGGRPHIRISKDAPVAAFTEVAATTPVFKIDGLERVRGT